MSLPRKQQIDMVQDFGHFRWDLKCQSSDYMYRYWYNYINRKTGDKAKLCYTDKETFIFQIKSEDI